MLENRAKNDETPPNRGKLTHFQGRKNQSTMKTRKIGDAQKNTSRTPAGASQKTGFLTKNTLH